MSATISLTQTDIEILLAGGTPKCMIEARVNPNKISTRRFLAEVLERDGSFVEVWSGLTTSSVNQLRSEMHKKGWIVNVTEVSSVTESGMTLTFPAHKDVPIVVGRTQFATPEQTLNKVEMLKRRAIAKGIRGKVQDGRNVEHPTKKEFVILSPLFEAFMAKKGFTVYLNGEIEFQGAKEGALDRINSLIKEGFEKHNISIMVHAENKLIQL
jgi:hypothetical protein